MRTALKGAVHIAHVGSCGLKLEYADERIRNRRYLTRRELEAVAAIVNAHLAGTGVPAGNTKNYTKE